MQKVEVNAPMMILSKLLSIKLVVFDLDGTLVDAYPAITESVNATLSAFGYPRQKAGVIRKAVGRGDRKLLESFISEKDSDAMLRYYRRHHACALKRSARLLPGAREILQYLVRKKYRLAVASNRPTRFSRILLRHLRIRSYFNYVLCGDALKIGKPHPEILCTIMKKLKVSPQETVFVGDMAIDAQTARAAGVTMVLVSGGSSSLAELRAQKPYRIIRSLNTLKQIV